MNSKIKINRLDKKSLSSKSKQWIKKHLNDPFVRSAQKDGYICRAAYKLMEIQEKFNLFSKAHNIVELGSSPGGWSQVLSQILHSGRVFAIDLLPMKFVHHKIFFIQGDFVLESDKIIEKINLYNGSLDVKSEEKQEKIQFSEEETAFQKRSDSLKEILLGGLSQKTHQNKNIEEKRENIKINGVVSDMSPNCSGDNQVDHWRIMDLAEQGFIFAKNHLAKGGYFVCKIFFGGDEKKFANHLKLSFKEVSFFKPDSSRKDSSEIYIVAKNFIGK